jgi:TonB family protein
MASGSFLFHAFFATALSTGSVQVSRGDAPNPSLLPVSPNQARIETVECPAGSYPRMPSLNPAAVFGDAWHSQPEPTVSGGYQVMQPLNTPEVGYPLWQRLNKRGGYVSVIFLVGANGRVEDARVACSDNEKLHGAVLDAVKNMRFQPSRVDGKPIKDVGLQPFDFRVIRGR